MKKKAWAIITALALVAADMSATVQPSLAQAAEEAQQVGSIVVSRCRSRAWCH